ncbi:hypothetical protein IE53DRAFT_250019 [Violaceomyces palustris]|uniref:Uncharacterized protein n=1 Tax=Violaceomyces palustris TaxID=1673888 RepID=A0ACD0P3X2_9BASI|nr:hypothetical protein IE53DRAFT_250019 [Violaceomyces palustris]
MASDPFASPQRPSSRPIIPLRTHSSLANITRLSTSNFTHNARLGSSTHIALNPVPTSLHDMDAVAEAVYSVKLLEALRKGDQAALHPFLTAVKPDARAKEMTSPLHLAVKCAEYSTIELCLDYKSIDVNAVDSQTGNTPLHLAAEAGRDDVVQLLLDQEDIDDTKRNKAGKEAIDVAKTPEIVQLIQVSRAKLNMQFVDYLDAYERKDPRADEQLYALLDLPRASAIDLNLQSNAGGTTLLHEAVKRNDTRMIETAVRKGADVFCRDRRGKRVGDMTKDEKVKALLRQLSNADAARQSQGTPGHPPSFKGYMGKWTNIAGGYKMRWFVLENGVLSYYHSQDEEGKQVRGAINMRFAKIRADSNDKHRLEIISQTGKGASKLYLRGAHPVERARWVQVLTQTREYFDMEKVTSRPESLMYSQLQGSTSSLANQLSATPSASASSTNLPGSIRPAPSHRNTMSSILGAKAIPIPAARQGSSASNAADRSPSIISKESRLSSDGRDEADLSGEELEKGDGLPHEHEFPLVANSLRTQVELSEKLIESLSALGSSGLSSSPAVDSQFSRSASSRISRESFRQGYHSSPEGLREALTDALKNTSDLVSKYQQMVADRELYMKKQYEREIHAKHLWEENMKVLAQQHAEMENSLKEAAKENARKRKVLREVRETMGSSPLSMESPLPPTKGTNGALAPAITQSRRGSAMNDVFSTPPQSLAARRVGETGPYSADALQLDSQPSPPIFAHARAVSQIVDEELSLAARESMDDADDEFFDAIEQGNLPGLRVETPIAKKRSEAELGDVIPDDKSVLPYKDLRTAMPLGKDDRPSVSLWAILKNNIGKDLTKISFPVSFNEPTSMLQRMAEDMLYAPLLDVAVQQKDPMLRIAYVAAFACSNYVTTIGRVAKPFNPMLGETFEYVNFEGSAYRYQSEQVSHHPPISACIGEALDSSWTYAGCVQAQSKFLGRSFEIRPTGVAHVRLKTENGIEHFTYKKVTTSVSGFITGSPSIDHYGDMLIKNHTTGDECKLAFKPRGWKASTAHELKGGVYSGKDGSLTWEIAGRWSTQLVARRVGTAETALDPDKGIEGQSGGVRSDYVLLWKHEPFSPGPFNLNPYAIRLNDLPKGLRQWLPPTDCRLRPDLRLFESGKFDEADVMKRNLEEYQRATRRKREAGSIPPHQPRFFTKVTDPDSQADLWEPRRSKDTKGQISDVEYWIRRERKDWEGCEEIFGPYMIH